MLFCGSTQAHGGHLTLQKRQSLFQPGKLSDQLFLFFCKTVLLICDSILQVLYHVIDILLVNVDCAGINFQYIVEGVLHRAGEALFYADSRCEGPVMAQIDAELQSILRVNRVSVSIELDITGNNVAAECRVPPC